MGLFTPSNIDHFNYPERAKFLLIWRLTLVFIFLLAALSILFLFFQDSYAFITYLLGFFITTLGLFYLKKTKNYKLIFLIYTISGTIIIQTDLNQVKDSHHYANFLWMATLSAMAFYGLGKRWGLIVLLGNCLGVTYFILFNLSDHYEIIVNSSIESNYLLAIEVTIVMAINSYLTWLSIKGQQLAEQGLRDANSELEATNNMIQKRDDERTLLIKEIHHRVKNNLQIIISLLRLQMTDVRSVEAKKHFSEAINRVMVMSSIHQKLYRQAEIAQFDLNGYIEELAQELKNFFKEEFPVSFHIDANYNTIELKTIVPLGLMLNELISNSLKYAFETNDSGEISIKIEEFDDYFTLRYADNGIWKKSTRDDQGFGIELIDLFTEQLNGSKEFETNEKGSVYTFRFNKL